jgi:hypothetical protein
MLERFPIIGLLRKKVYLFGPNGERNTFFFGRENGKITISQKMEDGKEAHWQPRIDYKLITINTQQEALNFLEMQMYTTTMNRKAEMTSEQKNSKI